MHSFARRRRAAIVMCASLALTFAACGGDDSGSGDTSSADTSADTSESPETSSGTDAPGTTETAAGTSPDESVATGSGCGDGSFTDLQPLGQNVEGVARCEPGSPSPQPLAERQKLTIATSSLSSEIALPLLLAQQHGEFEKENLEVEVQVLPPTDALPLLIQDQIDAQISSAGAAIFNASASGFGLRWVMPNNFSPPGNMEGLWARGADVQLEDVADMKIASAVGLGSPVSYNMQTELAKVGISWGDLQFEVIEAADIPEALRSGAVDAAVMISPFWVPFADDPDYTHLINSTPAGEPLSAVLFAPKLVGERHDAGVAFTRAWIRTINTYLRGPDYKADPAFCEEVANLLQQEVASFCSVPGSVFDYEVKSGTTDRMQDVYLDLDVLDYDEPLAEEQLVDRSFVEEAIGHSYGAG